jgi:hypothetical protein
MTSEKTKEQEINEELQQQMAERCKRAGEKIEGICKEESVKIVVAPMEFDNGIIYIAQLVPIELQRNVLQINPPKSETATPEDDSSHSESSGLNAAHE